ncbi:hypothetical protein TorRG33x02_015670 [Trema orientale]|uniref:43kDa postsynaptic protein n=1 Tax=Trema orientale TaxID=63057 RepID=A0A2P5FXQ6_TREOI|nr:hypothetical protein TorRG33x02_015670 [Trema orientale]
MRLLEPNGVFPPPEIPEVLVPLVISYAGLGHLRTPNRDFCLACSHVFRDNDVLRISSHCFRALHTHCFELLLNFFPAPNCPLCPTHRMSNPILPLDLARIRLCTLTDDDMADLEEDEQEMPPLEDGRE